MATAVHLVRKFRHLRGLVIGDAMLDIVGIGHNLYVARLLQRPQPFHRCCELHSIVGGLWFRAENLALLVAVPENAGPTARAGIADTRAVGDELNLFHRALGLHRPIRREPR